MAKVIQIRNVPAAVRKRLEVRAAAAGETLSEYLLAEITRFAELPTREEMRQRLRANPRVRLAESAAKMIRRERG
jgi:plasmid stability protein